MQDTSINSRKWKKFGWKNQTCFFITAYIKNKPLHIQQQCYLRLCGHIHAKHLHIVRSCEKLNISLTLRDIFGYVIPEDITLRWAC